MGKHTVGFNLHKFILAYSCTRALVYNTSIASYSEWLRVRACAHVFGHNRNNSQLWWLCSGSRYMVRSITPRILFAMQRTRSGAAATPCQPDLPANLLPISLAWTGSVLGTKQDSAASKSTKVSLKIKNHPLKLYTSQ